MSETGTIDERFTAAPVEPSVAEQLEEILSPVGEGVAQMGAALEQVEAALARVGTGPARKAVASSRQARRWLAQYIEDLRRLV